MSEHKPFKPPMPTAPQPEVLPRETNAIMEALEIRESELLDRIAALEAELAVSNLFASTAGREWKIADEERAEAVCSANESRGKIAALEAELAEAQERLAMAVEASQALLSRLRSLHENEEYRGVWMIAQLHRGPYRGPQYEKEMIYLDNALSATAASVAQHTAEVERRGAKAALEAFAERDDWTLDVPRSLVDRIRRLLTAEARAAEVERLDSDKT